MREEHDPIDQVRKRLIEGDRRRGEAQGDRQGGEGHRRRRGRVRPGQPRARSGRALDRRLTPSLAISSRMPPDAAPSRPQRAETDAMPTEVLMPALSPTMTEGKIARWLKKRGRHGQGRRRARRDRDRQGDDGDRGGRRGHARPHPRARRHRERRRQHADRGDRRRGEDVAAAEAAPARRARMAAHAAAAAGAAGTARRDLSAAPPRRRLPTPRRGRAGMRPAPPSRSPCARRCATRSPRRCGATTTCS